MRAVTESGTIRTPWATQGHLRLGALDSMIQRSPPKPAMPPHWVYGLLAAIGLVASPLGQAQTPAVSPVFAMSGSRNIDGVVLGPDGALYGAASTSSSLTGALFYDSNGNLAGGSVQLATLTTKPALTFADFIVI